MEGKERPYQAAALEGARVEFRKGARSVLLTLPTGTGKSWIFRRIIAGVVSKGKRALLLVQGINLVRQAAAHLRTLGVTVGVEMGEDKVGPVHQLGLMDDGPQIIVASKDSIIRRLKHYPRDYFRMIVLDEAHHVLAKSYLTILEHFGVSVPRLNDKGRLDPSLGRTDWSGNILFVGLTATPDRGDHGDIMQVFDAVGYKYGIAEAIEDGWLVPIEQEFCHLEGLDLQAVRKSAGDLDARQIEEAIRPVLRPLCEEIVRRADGRPTLIYNPLVTMADATTLHVGNIKGAGRIVTVTADTADREELFKAMARREVWAFSSVGTLTEGVDIPCATVGAMLRFTLSRPLYAQIMGRILRPAEELAHALNDLGSAAERRAAIAASSKPKALMLDFVGNAGKHKLIHVADIIGADEDEKTMELANGHMARGCRDPFAAIERAKKELAEIVARVTGTELQRVLIDPFALFSVKVQRDKQRRPPTAKQVDALLDCGAVRYKSGDAASREKARAKVLERFDLISASRMLDESKRRREQGLANFKMIRLLVEKGLAPDRARTMSWSEGRAAMAELEAMEYKPTPEWIKKYADPPASGAAA